MAPGPRSATIVAVDAAEILAIDSRDVDELRKAHADVDRVLLQAVVDAVRRLTGQLLEALYLPVPERVARRPSR